MERAERIRKSVIGFLGGKMPAKSKLLEKQWVECKRLKDSGIAMKEIAKRFGVKYRMVIQHFAKYGDPIE